MRARSFLVLALFVATPRSVNAENAPEFIDPFAHSSVLTQEQCAIILAALDSAGQEVLIRDDFFVSSQPAAITEAHAACRHDTGRDRVVLHMVDEPRNLAKVSDLIRALHRARLEAEQRSRVTEHKAHTIAWVGALAFLFVFGVLLFLIRDRRRMLRSAPHL